MIDETQQDNATRQARRAALLDGAPVFVLGGMALALGSSPGQDTLQKTLWLATTTVFTLALVWVLFRAFRRADEYQRKIQLESMAVAFAVVLVALELATVLDAAGVIGLRQLSQIIFFGGLITWMVIADLRTRLRR